MSRTIRECYEEIEFCREMYEEMMAADRKEFANYWNACIAEKKRHIRKTVAEDLVYCDRGYIDRVPVGKIVWRHFDNYGYSVTKVFVPGEKWTDEEKIGFRERNFIHYKPTYYDCTGQVFTRRIKIINAPSGVIIYLFEAIDC